MDAMIGGSPDPELPKYKSHKTVHALEIESCTMRDARESEDPSAPIDHPGFLMTFADTAYAPRVVSPAVVARHFPEKGDFFVVYDDGYESISPRAPFVEGYSAVQVDKPTALELSDQEAGKFEVAPRVRLADIDNAIDQVFYATGAQIAGPKTEGIAALDVLTVCLVVLKNGFTVIGTSAPASPANFNAEYGRKLAYDDCRRQLWPLMGFELRQRLWASDQYGGDESKERAG